jgi:hypothetical protein
LDGVEASMWALEDGFSAVARTNQKGCLPRLSLSTLDMEVGKGAGTWTGMDWRILDRTIAWLYSCHWHAALVFQTC